jgi:hypothetical protein
MTLRVRVEYGDAMFPNQAEDRLIRDGMELAIITKVCPGLCERLWCTDPRHKRRYQAHQMLVQCE